MKMMIDKSALCGIALLGAVSVVGAEPRIQVTPSRPNATYTVGSDISWTVQSAESGETGLTNIVYKLYRGGLKTIGEGRLDLSAGPTSVTTRLDSPGTVLLHLASKAPVNGKTRFANGGAVVAPQQIKPSSERPKDFDVFWEAKLAELARTQMNPMLEKKPSETEGVDYWQLTMDNIRGTHIQGQLARPIKEGRFPALIIFQFAGVYALTKKNVTGPASDGWLVLNINAHDLPIDQEPAYYHNLVATDLREYAAIGNDDREASYFLRMFLASSRAVDYLATRSDWNGKVMLVSGSSQGGLQALVAAALNPKVTEVHANAPAGGDHNATLVGRAAGWPYWMKKTTGKQEQKLRETAGYYDAVNFTSRITCPVLVGMGLLDITARPEGILAAINQVKGPVENVLMPDANHDGPFAAFNLRQKSRREELRKM